MMSPFKVIGISVPLLLASAVGRADEGFYLLTDLGKLPLSQKSFKIEISQIFDPTAPSLNDAVCLVAGDGTGSFVSDQGLVLTNQHVVQAALQRQSTVERDLMAEGYMARSLSQDIPAIGYDLRIIVDYRDVTDSLESALGEAQASERGAILQKTARALAGQLVSQGESGRHCQISLMHRDAHWYILRLMTIQDVRLVYAPPHALARFGGDQENWRWPSHAADFALLRAYVSPEGEGAPYAAENVPYRPRRHLTLSCSGIEEGDFVFALGFPGASDRYKPSSALAYQRDVNLPWEVQAMAQQLDRVEAAGERDEAMRIRLAKTREDLANGLIRDQGMLEGLQKHDLIQDRREREAALGRFIAVDATRSARFRGLLDAFDALYAEQTRTAPKEHVLAELTMFCDLFNTAREIGELAAQNPPSKEDIQAVVQSIRMRAHAFCLPVDQALFAQALGDAIHIPSALAFKAISDRFSGLASEVLDQAIGQYADRVYGQTLLADTSRVLPLLIQGRLSDLVAQDPMMAFVAGLAPDLAWMDERNGRFLGESGRLEEEWLALMKTYLGDIYYPDSDMTLRLTYGSVKGYSPKDAVQYEALTHASGLLDKITGTPPFDIPEKAQNLLADSPGLTTAFLADLDIIGGNSGSPVLNGQGELVGVVYDRNYEAMIAEYAYLPEINRALCADIRYLLILLDKTPGAASLVKEIRQG